MQMKENARYDAFTGSDVWKSELDCCTSSCCCLVLAFDAMAQDVCAVAKNSMRAGKLRSRARLALTKKR